jgi:hypothetical protein
MSHFHYDNGEVRCSFERPRSPTPTNPSYSPQSPSYKRGKAEDEEYDFSAPTSRTYTPPGNNNMSGPSFMWPQGFPEEERLSLTLKGWYCINGQLLKPPESPQCEQGYVIPPPDPSYAPSSLQYTPSFLLKPGDGKKKKKTKLNKPCPLGAEELSYDDWVKMSNGEHDMWKRCGYYDNNCRVYMDPRSPKCWAINQQADDSGLSYNIPSSPPPSTKKKPKRTGLVFPEECNPFGRPNNACSSYGYCHDQKVYHWEDGVALAYCPGSPPWDKLPDALSRRD